VTAGPALLPCVRKGCPWRGPDPDACPLHESDDAWERQAVLQSGQAWLPSRKQTRHR
jgi:hypothetical protein